MPESTVSIEEMFMLIGQQAVRIYMLEKERDALLNAVQALNTKLEEGKKGNAS